MGILKQTKEDFSFYTESDIYTDKYIDRSMEISDRINAIISKTGITQKELASKLNKSESEISRWLTGVHNFTIKTLSKLEVALEESIFLPVNGEEYVKVGKKEQYYKIDEHITISEAYLRESVMNYNFAVLKAKISSGISKAEWVISKNEQNELRYIGKSTLKAIMNE